MTTALNRRQLIVSSPALPFALRALAAPPISRNARWVLLGTDKGQGIYRASWDAATGKLGAPELAIATARPDFLAVHPRLPMVYAVNAGNVPGAGLSAFSVDPANAVLQARGELPTGSDGPCFTSVDPTGRLAFVANYTGGSLSTFSLKSDGSPDRHVGQFQARQATPGPVAERQDAAHLHSATVAPGGRFVLVCDLGGDAILSFPIDPAHAHVGAPRRTPSRPGSGPRHVAFHPNRRWVYCIHELDCTVEVLDWTPGNARMPLKLRAGTTVSLLPSSASLAGNTAAEIAVSEDGRFVYTCTRGENSLSVFGVNASDGTLKPLQRLSCGGEVPRYFALDPTQRWLVCCNQASSTLTVFARDPSTGQLKEKPHSYEAETPMFCIWV